MMEIIRPGAHASGYFTFLLQRPGGPPLAAQNSGHWSRQRCASPFWPLPAPLIEVRMCPGALNDSSDISVNDTVND